MIRRALLLPAVLGPLLATPGTAVTIDHGDCEDLAGGGSVTYEQVTESNAGSTELYRAPSCVGNLIDFDPLGFEAKDDVSGNVDPVELAGLLDFAIQASSGHTLSSISLSESGDEQVDSLGGAAWAMATMTVDLSILISDGEGGEIAVAYQDVQSVSFAYPADGSATVEPWSIAGDYVVGEILGQACLGQGQYTGNAVALACGATSDRVLVQVDNLLEAFAEDDALAFINKKDADSVSITTLTQPVPEPTTGLLLGLGLLGLARAGRRRG